MINTHNIIILSGATATGKTKLAIQIHEYLKSHHLKSAIINFDSLCFYNEISIGTAKPTPVEQTKAPHYLVNISSIANPIDAYEFKNLATPLINRFIENQTIPILVGGSGFYLRALIKGMYQSNENRTDQEFKQNIQNEYKKNGIKDFLIYLEKYDPVSFETLHHNDHYRIMRAYEFHLQNKIPISSLKLENSQNAFDFSLTREKNWSPAHFYLQIPKELHLSIISDRVHRIIDDGLIDEVNALLERGFTGDEKPLKSIGYKETVSFLKGQLESITHLKERINISTRQLAKAQKTFFKKVHPKNTYNPLKQQNEIFQAVYEHCINKI